MEEDAYDCVRLLSFDDRCNLDVIILGAVEYFYFIMIVRFK
jgi:hypothetical protein